MVSSLALYLRMVGYSVRAQFAYRLSFLALALGAFVSTGAEFVAIWFLFQRFHQVGGWGVHDAAVLYGVVNLGMALPDLTSSGFEQCGTLVRKGDFDRLLLRPRGTALQLAGREFALRRLGRVAQAAAVLAWGLARIGRPLGWSDAALLAWAICGGIAVFLGLFLIEAAISFWTLQSLEVMAVLIFGGVEASVYPMHIYNRWLQRLFLGFVPVATVSYFPVLSVLHKPDPFGLPIALRLMSPLAGLLFLLCSTFVWRLGVRRYASTGS